MNNNHAEFLVNNRHKVSIADYITLLKMLEPDIAVSPMEQISVSCGKRKVGRATKQASRAYSDIHEAAELNSKTKLLYPVLFEHADDFYAHIDDETRSNLQGVLLFNGLDHLSLKLGARFDSVRTLRQ